MEKTPNKTQQIKVGISIGDVNGIGPEIIVKALKDSRVLEEFTPVIYGTAKAILNSKNKLEAHDFSHKVCATPDQIEGRKINLINCSDEEVEIKEGVPTAQSAKLAIKAL